MHYHSNDFVTLVCTSDDDSCFTPIDKELAGRLQLTSKSLLKRKQFWWITAISVDHRNCRFVYVSTVTVVNNSCEFRQAKRHTRDSRCVLFASCVAALGHFLVLLLLPRIGGLHPARVVMASDDVPNRERQDKCASPAKARCSLKTVAKFSWKAFGQLPVLPAVNCMRGHLSMLVCHLESCCVTVTQGRQCIN